ncbi:MAG: RNase P subunit p30 family protein [Euryarchaeota archaeon]|nr:RNase P subunit p30 family protein [Euryarchaeota archaeon]
MSQSEFNCTDACVHPFPAGDTSVRRFAIEAKELGFDSIVCTGLLDHVPDAAIHVYSGMIIHEYPINAVIRKVKKYSGKTDVVIVDAGDAAFNRAAVSYNGIHILRGVHRLRKNSFDHVAARTAAEKNVAVDLDIRPLIYKRGSARQKVFQCYSDLMRLHNRYEFPLTISGNASSYLDLRSERGICSLCSIFGLDEDGVSYAMGNVSRLLNRAKVVEVIEE